MKIRAPLVVLPLAWLVSASSSSLAQLSVYTAPSLARIVQTAAPVRQPDVAPSAARAEWESFQVVVHAGANSVSNVNLSLSSLSGANGATIDAGNITLYRESYVTVRHPTPGVG